ncbi:MAG TPA: nucleotidyltransferase family protein [Anaerolineales bacterium]|jgi:NDP-sugar pyrophosphorylase family protein|nr:nucleotidyltransferase family protein [Anaerolineales bacterium]
MQALILAGGLGERLRSIVNDRPKPMAHIGEKPFLEYQLEFLKRQGVNHLVLCVGYRHRQIQEYFGSGEHWGVHIDYSVEAELLGTAGAIKQAHQYITGRFLALNGDTFFGLDLGAFIKFHELDKLMRQRYIASIALARVREAGSYGLVLLDDNDHVLQFLEKQQSSADDNAGSKWVNAGIYILEPEILDHIPGGKKVSIERDIFPALLEAGFVLGGYQAQGAFIDIGTPDGYYRFQTHILGRK